MKKKHSLAYYIVIFIFVQIIWLSIAGLWISRYVINNVIYNRIGETYSVKIPDGGAVEMFIIGLSLILLAATGMSMLFRYLNVQFNLARLYDIFIANITHELKTPISSMQISMDTLKKKNLDDTTRDKFLSNIENDTKKLKNLIDNVLVVSRLEQKMQIFDCRVRNAQVLFEQLIEKIKNENDLVLIFKSDIPEDLEMVVDENALLVIFKNLVDNSIKYSVENTQVSISVSQYKKWISIICQDNGVGIPKKMRGKIFKKFYRGANKDLPNVKGTGLGLYLVKEIMKFHGGNIKIVNSENENGTKFQMLIPIFGKKKTRYLNKIRE